MYDLDWGASSLLFAPLIVALKPAAVLRRSSQTVASVADFDAPICASGWALVLGQKPPGNLSHARRYCRKRPSGLAGSITSA